MKSDIITEVAKYKRGWTGGGDETPCGFGSKVTQTKVQRKWLPKMVAEYGIHSINDIGAGDLNWIPLVQWPHPIQYTPFDLVPRQPSVQPFDLIHEIPRPADAILCLWVLNHLPESHARQALQNLLACKAKYLFYTWWPDMFDFLDLGTLESAVMRTAHKADRKISYEIRLIRI